MGVLTVADVISRAEQFEQMLSDYYATLAEHTEREGVRLLTDYLSRHRIRIVGELERLSPEQMSRVRSAPLPYEPQAADCR